MTYHIDSHLACSFCNQAYNGHHWQKLKPHNYRNVWVMRSCSSTTNGLYVLWPINALLCDYLASRRPAHWRSDDVPGSWQAVYKERVYIRQWPMYNTVTVTSLTDIISELHAPVYSKSNHLPSINTNIYIYIYIYLSLICQTIYSIIITAFA